MIDHKLMSKKKKEAYKECDWQELNLIRVNYVLLKCLQKSGDFDKIFQNLYVYQIF